MSLRSRIGAAVLLVLWAAPALSDRTDVNVLVVGDPLAPGFEALVVLGYIGDGSILIDDTPVSPFLETIDAIALGAGPGGTGELTVTGPGTSLVMDGDPTFHNAGFILGAATQGGGNGIAHILDGATVDVDGTASDPNDMMGAYLVLSPFPNATSDMTVDASTVTVRNGSGPTSNIGVGIEGYGRLTISGGGSVSLDTGAGSGGGISSGVFSAGEGELIVTGAGSELVASGDSNQYAVGLGGLGTLDVLDGASLVGQRFNLAVNAGSEGTSEIAGGSSVDLSGVDLLSGLGAGIAVGIGGTGELNVSDSTITIDGSAGGISPGVLIGGSTVPPSGGDGVMRVRGAAAQVDLLGPAMAMAVGLDAAGTLEVSDGAGFEAENPGGNTGMSIGLLSGSSGTVRVTGAGSRLGAGESILMGVDLGLADTGTALLEVGEGASVTVGNVFLGSAATLTGDGAISGNVVNLRGTLMPGGSPGVLDVGGSVQQGSAATLRLQAVGIGPADSGRIAAGGSVDVAGSLEFELLAGFLPEQGQELLFATSGAGASIDPNTVTGVAGVAPGFQFEVVTVNAGNDLVLRALSDAEGFGACQVSQLKAASALCKGHFLCASKYAKKPGKDPGEVKRAACEQKAVAKFEKRYDKAAGKSPATCGSGDPAATTAATVGAGADAVIDRVLFGWDPAADEKDDDKLRGGLLKQAGVLCGKLASAASKNLKKPADDKRVARMAKARGAFDKKAAKALDKAAAAGVVYAGAALAEIGDETEGLAARVAGVTAGVAP